MIGNGVPSGQPGILAPEHVTQQRQKEMQAAIQAKAQEQHVLGMMLMCAQNVMCQLVRRDGWAGTPSHPELLAKFSYDCAKALFKEAGVTGTPETNG